MNEAIGSARNVRERHVRNRSNDRPSDPEAVRKHPTSEGYMYMRVYYELQLYTFEGVKVYRTKFVKFLKRVWKLSAIELYGSALQRP